MDHTAHGKAGREGSLSGRVALVTGVSRRRGIGFAIASRLAARGAHLVVTHHQAHDAEQPWGADDLEAVLAGIRARRLHPDQRLVDVAADLSEPGAPEEIMQRAVIELGHVDILVCNHARSGGDGALGQLTAEMLDMHWAVNARSTLLLVQAFAAQHDGRPGGRVVLMTSGQGQGPMPGEIAYATSKAALAGITVTLADQLADVGVTVNTVNPGPVDTGYVTEELAEHLAPLFPLGRWGEPDDPARLIEWLVSDAGRWMTGQVLHSEGGFARWRHPAAGATRQD
ncbi:SDR family oxidoreductase [Agrococcus sp. Ld7]|uniref:SDR family oxidoreductase n=1 Tax=Agrococcus sp. Ld7 TaxID=649148 RepID=UPI00386B5CEE